MKRKKKKNNTIYFILLIAIFTSFMGIGYATISSIDMEIDGSASLSRQSGVYITNVSYSTNTNANPALSSINMYYQTNLDSTIVLNNNLNSSITYEITVINTSGSTKQFDGVVFDSNFYDNNDIIIETTGITTSTTLNDNDTITFYATFKYDSNVTTITNTTLNSFVNFKFVEPQVTPPIVGINLYANAVYNPVSSTVSTTWSPNASVNGYNASTGQYKLAKTTYSGSLYTSTTLSKENLSWKIWDIDQTAGTVTLISTTPTSKRMSLRGHLGFVNGVYLLNEAVEKLYGSGPGVVSARNMNLRDIEEKMILNHGGAGYVDANGRPIYSEANVSSIVSQFQSNYGQTNTINNRYLVDAFDNNEEADITGLGMSDTIVSTPYSIDNIPISQKTSIVYKQTRYNIQNSDLANLLDQDAYNLVVQGTEYFLATRALNQHSTAGVAYQTMQSSTDGILGINLTTGANNNGTAGNAATYKLRPMITLDLSQVSYTVAQDGTVTFS